MPNQFYIQRAAFEESEDPNVVLITQSEWDQAVQAEPSVAPLLSEFTYKDGRVLFQAEEWNPQDAGSVTAAARRLAQALNARVFGEDDEEYPL